MTQTNDTDLAQRARRVHVACQTIDVALMARPGALPPGEKRGSMGMLNTMVRGVPGLLHADPDRQIDAALGFLSLWQSVLSDQADHLWPDPDESEGR
ncbi:hypothetical protein [Mycolicibacterium hippocampi]|uniref:Uncharacterized protein n=1 Tax=Mycolicibacterium hippocampi TaxID=659824 RepID=A0A7I9ZWK2_9MYCO|nr:hypothetical protein [Mycolicibacterium hippocampi]GFH05038.1 hypothetical protein MHIP_55210 [Mycolicibacterium hippocampi]